MLKLLLRSVLWGLAGAALLPLSGIAFLAVAGALLELLAFQRGAGGSGGFEMGLASILLMLVPAGAISFFVMTLFRGLRRRGA